MIWLSFSPPSLSQQASWRVMQGQAHGCENMPVEWRAGGKWVRWKFEWKVRRGGGRYWEVEGCIRFMLGKKRKQLCSTSYEAWWMFGFCCVFCGSFVWDKSAQRWDYTEWIMRANPSQTSHMWDCGDMTLGDGQEKNCQNSVTWKISISNSLTSIICNISSVAINSMDPQLFPFFQLFPFHKVKSEYYQNSIKVQQ